MSEDVSYISQDAMETARTLHRIIIGLPKIFSTFSLSLSLAHLLTLSLSLSPSPDLPSLRSFDSPSDRKHTLTHTAADGEEKSYRIPLSLAHTPKKSPSGVTRKSRWSYVISPKGSHDIISPKGTQEAVSPKGSHEGISPKVSHDVRSPTTTSNTIMSPIHSPPTTLTSHSEIQYLAYMRAGTDLVGDGSGLSSTSQDRQISRSSTVVSVLKTSRTREREREGRVLRMGAGRVGMDHSPLHTSGSMNLTTMDLEGEMVGKWERGRLDDRVRFRGCFVL